MKWKRMNEPKHAVNAYIHDPLYQDLNDVAYEQGKIKNRTVSKSAVIVQCIEISLSGIVETMIANNAEKLDQETKTKLQKILERLQKKWARFKNK